MSKVLKGTLLAAAIVFTGGAAGIVLGPAGAGLIASSAGLFAAVNALAASAFLSGVSSQLAGSKKQPRATASVEYAGTVEPRRILYGFNRVSGMHALPPVTTGTSNKFLHKVLVLAGHQCNAISAVYFDTNAVGTIAAVSGGSGDGLVSTGTYANKAWVRRYLGTSGQTADYILDNALAIWTSNHRGRGVTYVAIQKELDETIYKNGDTQDTFDVEGKLCYDPRLDSSPGNDPTNATYKAYTRNPALQLADYLIDDTLGMGETASRIDWDMVVDAADICEELVTVPTASTQTRYEGNLVLYATSAYEDNITALTTCMMGSCLYSGGKWRIRAGAWETPSFEITDSDVMGPLVLATAYPYKDRFNSVRGVFIDPANNYQLNDFPPVSNPTYVTADNSETIWRDIQIDGCNRVYEAERQAILLTRKSRNWESATVPCSLRLWKVRPGDTGIATITELGWSSQQIRCEAWGFTADGQVALTIRAENSADWNDPIEADYVTPTAITTPTPVAFTPAAPSGLASTGGKNGITLSWTAPALVPTGAKYQLWMHTSSTPFGSATKVWEGNATNAFIARASTATVYFWVLLVMPDGTAGTEYPTSAAGVSGAAILIGTNDLDANAATVPQSAESASGTVVSSSGGSGSTDILTLTWTNSTSASVEVQVDASVVVSCSAAGTGVGAALAQLVVDDGGVPVGPVMVYGSQAIVGTDSPKESGSAVKQWSLASGATLTAKMRIQAGRVSGIGVLTTSYESAVLRVTAILR